MFGRRRGMETAGSASSQSSATLTLPPTARLLSCRVLDTVHQPVRQAKFEVTDPIGRRVVSGETDPYGGFTAAMPEGEYRLSVSAEGYAPFHGATLVGDPAQPGTAEIILDAVEPPLLPQPGHWELDPTHSSIGFTARHIGFARIHGRFTTFAGAVRIAERMEDSSMHVIIDAASIDTGLRMRDDHLRSRTSSTPPGTRRWSSTASGSSTAAAAGGRSRARSPCTASAGPSPSTPSTWARVLAWRSEPRAACRATTELHREDFALNWQSILAHGIAAIGSSVEVELDVQIVHKA